MSISIVTNFKVNTYGPIDTRLVATNSAALSEIEFPYEGLTVFTKDQNLNYTYNGTPPFGTWQVSSNGIYGGSGSLVGNTDVNIGSVGPNLNDKSYEYILSASSSLDRAQMVTSFIRNSPNEEYKTVEVRNQVRFLDNGSLLNGPYISFNKSDDKKGIISLGTPDRLFTTTVERFRIEPDSTSNNGAIVMVPSTYSLPMYFSQKTSGEMFIGYNWNGTDKITSGTGSSIISFKSTGEISLSNIFSTNTTIAQQLVIGEVNNNVSSTVKFRVDDSGKDMGAGQSILRTHNLRTIPEIVRNVEHKYTKLQSQGYKSLSTYIDGGTPKPFATTLQSTKILYITGDGNFFDFVLPTTTLADGFGGEGPEWNTIYDIRIARESLLGGTVDVSDAPDGTEVTIRFTYGTAGRSGIKPTKIYLWQSDTQSLRKIKSSYADTNGGEYITILQGLDSTDPTGQDANEIVTGDIITFRKSGDGFWYVTNINREKSILSTISNNLTWNFISDVSDYITPQDPLRRFRVPLAGEEPPTSYSWTDDNDSVLKAATSSFLTGSDRLDYPFKHKYSDTNAARPYTDVNRAISLGVAKDLFGNVYLKGSFQITDIPFTALNRSYQLGMGNKFYIANIIDPAMIPSSTGDNLYTTWGYCEIIVRNSVSTGLPFNQGSSGAVIIPGRISVDSDGRVFLQFHMSFWTSLSGIYRLDVNVPQFSYSTT